jgi:membrane protein implicated in regulation of membrane protease activity
VASILILSLLMILNHLSLIIFGILELYFTHTLWFYNVFCTLLFVTDPILIFIPTVILQHLFAVQAKRKQTQRENQAEYIQSFLEDISIFEKPRGQRAAGGPLHLETKQCRDDLESE